MFARGRKYINSESLKSKLGMFILMLMLVFSIPLGIYYGMSSLQTDKFEYDYSKKQKFELSELINSSKIKNLIRIFY